MSTSHICRCEMGLTEEQRPSPRRSPALPAPPALPALPPPIQPYSGFLGNIATGATNPDIYYCLADFNIKLDTLFKAPVNTSQSTISAGADANTGSKLTVFMQ
ncbi:hypothetical protein RR48_14017 [Papilio machaon]|uniref:Uncharacterized protein n=1 Tax=Papilio machaon TaxID=76193 RepID=A0A194RME4_PAPMA|nr:hypothetical protein RR48_14017 [Papilio machaon]